MKRSEALSRNVEAAWLLTITLGMLLGSLAHAMQGVL